MYKKILLVEDEVDIADIYARTLRNHGYEVDCQYDGESGLAQALSNKYDLILLDLMLPNKSGSDILRLLRDPAQAPTFDQATDIFMLTNFDMDDVTKQEIMSMAQQYLIKVDITPKVLVTILQDIDAKKQSTDSTQPPASTAPDPALS
jgi:two-component system OmpR family response regulator/two-component system chemotaxis response regulator CheY/two-component system response regulator QseB